MKTDLVTKDETKLLKRLEKTIKSGMGTLFKVAEALSKIKESRLYRNKYKTFEEYCDKRWNFTRRRAYQLIEAGETRDLLPENVKQCFTNVRQLNALAKLPKEARAGAAQDIICSIKKTGGKITANTIREATNPTPAPNSPLKGVDLTKLDPAVPPQPSENIHPPLSNNPPVVSRYVAGKFPIEPEGGTLTVAEFKDVIKWAVFRIPKDKDRSKYRDVLHEFAELLKPVKKEVNPYSAYTR